MRAALDRFLRAHEPYPALVVDRCHDIVAANDALATLTAGVRPGAARAPRERRARGAAPARAWRR